MASNWKYATLPAEKRLEMIKDGNQEVFNEEKARALSAIRSRQELGLPVEDQIAWADSVGYNNALYNAKGLGIDAADVEKSGYGERWLSGDNPQSLKLSGIIQNDRKNLLSEQMDAKNRLAEREYEKAVSELESETEERKRSAYNEAMRKIPEMRETFANLGLSAEGGTVRTHEMQADAALDAAMAELDKLLLSGKKELLDEKEKQKLQNLSEMLAEYRSALDKESESARAAQELQLKKDQLANDEARLELEKKAAELKAAEADRNYELKATEADRNYELENTKLSNELDMFLKELENRNETRKEDGELALLKLILGAENAEDRAFYMQLLRTYASEELSEMASDTRDSEGSTGINLSGELKADDSGGLSKEEIRQRVTVLRNFLRTEAERRDFYKKSGLEPYITYENAMKGIFQ